MSQKNRPQAETLYGLPQPLQSNLLAPIIAKRAPVSTDTGFPLTQFWDYKSANTFWVLLSVSAGAATWGEIITNGGGSVLIVANGGTGRATLTVHSVLLGEGTNPVNFAVPGATGIPLVSAGASADPHFSTATVPGGGTGAITLTAHGVLLGEGTSAVVATAVGTDGQVLTGNSAADPSFQAIGTKSGLTAHGVLLGEGASAFVATAAGATGSVFAGVSGVDPAFRNISEYNIIDNTTGTVGAPLLIAVSSTLVADEASVTSGFLLPTTALLGDSFTIIGKGPGGWQLQQAASQQIYIGSQATTVGTSGSISSVSAKASITLRAIVAGASTVWAAQGFAGTFTVV